jgi:hypothetical protein
MKVMDLQSPVTHDIQETGLSIVTRPVDDAALTILLPIGLRFTLADSNPVVIP